MTSRSLPHGAGGFFYCGAETYRPAARRRMMPDVPDDLERLAREADRMADKSPFGKDRERFRSVADDYRKRAEKARGPDGTRRSDDS